MIKLEALRVFAIVVEFGNIKDASQKLGRTPSAISMTLKQLDQEVGGPLFQSDRKNNLTALGEFVFEMAKTQLLSFDKSIGNIRAFAQNRIGRLTIASVPSIAANIIPHLLLQFAAERPGIEFELFDIDSSNVRAMVETGQADLGIAGQPPKNAIQSFQPLFQDRFLVICGSSCRLASIARPLNWLDLQNEPLILNGASQTIEAPEYRALASSASITVRNVTSLLALVKAGMGTTLLPSLAAQDLPEDLCALELADATVTRTVGLLQQPGLTQSPVAMAFRAFILEQMPALCERAGLNVTSIA